MSLPQLEEKPSVAFLEGSGKKVAYKRIRSKRQGRPGVLICNGLQQDMENNLAQGIILDSHHWDFNLVAFDYTGEGRSSTPPQSCTRFSSWLEDALNVLDHACGSEEQVLVGYFTGAWVALHLALQRPNRVKALVLIAPGIDITNFWWQHLREQDQKISQELRKVPLPSPYGKDGKSLPLGFYEDAEAYLLMKQPSIAIDKPVRIFQGLKDTVVPPALSRDLMAKLSSEDVHVTLIKNGEHQFSKVFQLYPIYQGVQDMVEY